MIQAVPAARRSTVEFFEAHHSTAKWRPAFDDDRLHGRVETGKWSFEQTACRPLDVASLPSHRRRHLLLGWAPVDLREHWRRVNGGRRCAFIKMCVRGEVMN
jgi:hypothetical protein